MTISNVRPEPDKVLVDIADYVSTYEITSTLAFETARLCLIDSIGCGLEALEYPACAKLLGPVSTGTVVSYGAPQSDPSGRLELKRISPGRGATLRETGFGDAFKGIRVVVSAKNATPVYVPAGKE